MTRQWKLQVVAALCSATVAVFSAGAQDKEAKEVGKAAGKKVAFVNDLVRLHEGEIIMSRLAIENSDNMRVHELATTLVNDHQRLLNDLRRWAEGRAIEVAEVLKMTEEGVGGAGEGLTAAKEEMVKELDAYEKQLAEKDAEAARRFREMRRLTGARFDQEYISTLIKDHEKALKMVKDGMREYKADASFAALLGQSEPVLKEHLAAAQALKKQL